MEFTSMRAFYLNHATPDSCTYCAFARKMKALQNDLGVNSGIKQINPTFIVVDLSKDYLYKALLENTHRRIHKL